ERPARTPRDPIGETTAMAKKSGTRKGLKKSPSSRKAGAGARSAKSSKGGRRKAAGKLKKRARKATAPRKAKAAPRKAKAAPRRAATAKAARPRRGGTGREKTLGQTAKTGRTNGRPTNPLPTKRSTGTPAGAGTTKSPRLERARRQ